VPEYVITIALVMIVSAGMLAAYLLGGRIFLMAQFKLDTTDDVRDLVSGFAHDVRTAVDFDIGQGSDTSFAPVTLEKPRKGNALQLYPTSSTNIIVRYFLDASNQVLKCLDTDNKVYVMATGITNPAPFTAEDLWGNVTTNDRPMEIIGMTLQFNPSVIRNSKDGSTDQKDYYQVRTRVNKRNSIGYQ
jgi:hypothetical protein